MVTRYVLVRVNDYPPPSQVCRIRKQRNTLINVRLKKKNKQITTPRNITDKIQSYAFRINLQIFQLECYKGFRKKKRCLKINKLFFNR